MKSKQLLILAIVVSICLFALVAVVSAQQSPHSPMADDPATSWTASGGNYHLTSLTWPRANAVTEVNAVSGGGDYRLLLPTIRGSGCCCYYMPCLLKNVP